MEVNDEYLLAAAVAHMVVTFQGKVWLQLQGGKAVMKSPESEGRAAAELTVSSLLDSGDEVAEMLRSRAIMEMLVERSEMEQASKSDRFLSGAKEVFSKYAFCRSVWMEMVQKLLAVGLVTVISTEDGLHLSLAYVLGMAATIAVVQPYIQPQARSLRQLHDANAWAAKFVLILCETNWGRQTEPRRSVSD
ncbi:unnamed protein product [Effrenium voratum]|nr:unnamed protein product [Effrenium voratum]